MRSNILVVSLIAASAWLVDVSASSSVDQRAVQGQRAVERNDAGFVGDAIDGAPVREMIVAPGRLNLRVGDVVTAQLPNLRNARPMHVEPRQRYVLQLDGPMTPERRTALVNTGVTLGDYLSTHSFIADLSQAKVDALMGLNFVTWIGRYRPEWKIDPDVGRMAFEGAERRAVRDAGRVIVEISLFEGVDLDPALDAITGIEGVNVLEEEIGELGGNIVIPVEMPLEHVQQLANIDEVQFVEEAAEFVIRRNNSVRGLVQTNNTSNTIFYTNNLRGEGQIVGILDSALDVNHCSFIDTENPIGPNHRKIHAYNTGLGSASHGTHVAGIAVGDAGSFTNTRGVAYMGRLVYNSMPNLSQTSVLNRHQTHHNQGARIHSNSWGSGDHITSYHGATRAIDLFMRSNEESLVVHSVANSSNPGTTISIPENAKNLLAIGATSKTNTNTHCTAKPGPTADGRRKPEVFAPGCNVNSASNSTTCSTTSSSGTSMATPATSGLALLVRQYYTEGYYPTGAPVVSNALTPSGALIKATIVNSAQRMTGSGTGSGYPNFTQGWGRAQGDFTIHFSGQLRRMIVHDQRNTVGLSTGQEATHTFEVFNSSEQLRVTLAFTDVAGASGASNPVVNDLDLEVISPSGTVYKGNHFVSNISAPGGDKDPINNVEQVHINNPPTGEWQVIVRAAAVNSGLQGYGLVVSGAVDSDDVVIPPPVPPNNTCTTSIAIGVGQTEFTTIAATTEGPDEAGVCGGPSTQVQNDVWFRVTAPCTGILTISVCDVDFNARLAVYGTSCPSLDSGALACNDDACDGAPEVSVEVTSGQTRRFRIGSSDGSTGSGAFNITCEVPNTCPADIDGDGTVDGFDLLLLLGNWGEVEEGNPADINQNGVVDGFDLLLLLGNWGEC